MRIGKMGNIVFFREKLEAGVTNSSRNADLLI